VAGPSIAIASTRLDCLIPVVQGRYPTHIRHTVTK
jgi:hypothetical protein